MYHGDSDICFAVGFLIYSNLKTACILIKLSAVCCSRNNCHSALVQITAQHQINRKVIDWLPSSMTHICASPGLNNLNAITHQYISFALQAQKKMKTFRLKIHKSDPPFFQIKIMTKICYFLLLASTISSCVGYPMLLPTETYRNKQLHELMSFIAT